MKFDIGNMISAPAAVMPDGILAVKELPVDMLVPYRDHPFILYSGERFEDMIVSVKKNGVLNPIIVRSKSDGKYEILAGHNRTEAAKQAGLTTVPAIVKNNITDAEAEMYVIETNLMQRGFKDLLISEQAYVAALRHSKMFDDKKLNAIHEELTAIELRTEEAKPDSKLALVGEEYGLSKTTIARLIRVHKLITACSKFKTAIDTNRLSVRAAVELSYISSAVALNVIFKKYSVSVVIDNMWFDVVKIDVGLAEQLRDMFEDFNGTSSEAETIIMTMQKIGDKPKKPKQFRVSADIYGKYFKEDDTEDHVNEVILEALEMYFSTVRNYILF